MILGISLLSVNTFGGAFSEIPRSFIGGGTNIGGIVGLATKRFDVSAAFLNSSTNSSGITQFTFSGQVKSALDSKGTYFTMGGLASVGLGTAIDSATAFGFTVGLQKELSDDVFLDAKILPISISSVKSGSTVSSTNFFTTTVMAVNYLF